MNADIQGILDYSKTKSIGSLIVTNNGYSLTHSEATRYLEWCVKQGHEYISDCPEYELVKDNI